MNIYFYKTTAIFFLCVYTLALLFILVYSIVQGHLIFKYFKGRKKQKSANSTYRYSNFPHVTIQLPLYNESLVVERLIDSVVSIDYPIQRLEIQVLDDSDDETVEIVNKKVNEYQKKGYDITHIRREIRKEYKAGALKYGLQYAKGEFIAIFDADFIPPTDFLKKTIFHFIDDKQIGVVQTRWGHLNENYSTLTKLQAFALDAHFTVEQSGRNYAGSFINFNGTGGVWRKSCIIDAGNWSGDTLTEDLDLSYRAQFKGWKFKYLQDMVTPAELPPVMGALKSQQFRWTKGGSGTARKHLGNVLKANFPAITKVHAIFHLINSTVFLAILISSLASVPLLFLYKYFSNWNLILKFGSIFFISFGIISLQYLISNLALNKTLKGVWLFISHFPLFLSVSMGLSLHNSIAVLEGLTGKKSAFIRTPKFNIHQQSKSLFRYSFVQSISIFGLLEGGLFLLFCLCVVFAIKQEVYFLLLFHLMLSLGFGIVFFQSIFVKKL